MTDVKCLQYRNNSVSNLLKKQDEHKCFVVREWVFFNNRGGAVEFRASGSKFLRSPTRGRGRDSFGPPPPLRQVEIERGRPL